MATKTEDRTDDRTVDTYIKDALALLGLRKQLDRHSLRSWVYKISEDIVFRQKSTRNCLPGYAPHWTESAWALRAQDKSAALHLEHPVPRGKIVRWLCELPQPTAADVSRAFDLFLLTCWVTTGTNAQGTYEGSEACALNRDGFKDSMPPDWNPLTGNPWARYLEVQKQKPGRLSCWATFEAHQQTTAARA